MDENWWIMIKQDSLAGEASDVSIRCGSGEWIADVGRSHDTEAILRAMHIVALHNGSLKMRKGK